jgi:hypothetical protein
MPYQECKADLAKLLTPAEVLATLTMGLLSHDPQGVISRSIFNAR